MTDILAATPKLTPAKAIFSLIQKCAGEIFELPPVSYDPEWVKRKDANDYKSVMEVALFAAAADIFYPDWRRDSRTNYQEFAASCEALSKILGLDDSTFGYQLRDTLAYDAGGNEAKFALAFSSQAPAVLHQQINEIKTLALRRIAKLEF